MLLQEQTTDATTTIIVQVISIIPSLLWFVFAVIIFHCSTIDCAMNCFPVLVDLKYLGLSLRLPVRSLIVLLKSATPRSVSKNDLR